MLNMDFALKGRQFRTGDFLKYLWQIHFPLLQSPTLEFWGSQSCSRKSNF
jgi:hypothetical protein